MTITPQIAGDELRGAIAVVGALNKVMAGEMDRAAFGELAEATILDLCPEKPSDFLVPLATVALAAVMLSAATLGTDVPSLLQQLALKVIPADAAPVNTHRSRQGR